MTSQSRAGSSAPDTLDLFWGDQGRPRRGPRPRLDLHRIVDAGIAVATAEGLEAVTMQRVAGQLGYTTMSLYRYVASKDQLIELMVDRALGDPPELTADMDWRRAVFVWCEAMFRQELGRPWILARGQYGPPRGPRALAWLDAAVAALGPTGLSPEQVLQTASYLSLTMRAMARVAYETGRTSSPEPDDEEPPAERVYGEVLRRAVNTGNYPALGMLLPVFEDEPRMDPEPDADTTSDAFVELGVHFALARFLDGIESYTQT